MNPQELAELDLAVAKAEGKTAALEYDHCFLESGHTYKPTRDGAEAMRLLEKYGLWVEPYDGRWLAGWCVTKFAGNRYPDGGEAATPAIAICRAVVAMKEQEEQ